MNERTFNTGDPIAYFITWTTYGTWLPGDDRGSHRWRSAEVEIPNKLQREMAASQMKETAFTLAPANRELVEAVIRRHCEIRQWRLWAVNPRSNHIHVVVTATGYQPDTVRGQFKAWGTRELKRVVKGRERFWTEGGSCRWINNDSDLEAAILYVLEGQDKYQIQARRASE